MNKCKNCGTANETDGKYCKECGHKLLTSQDDKSKDVIRIGELVYTAYMHMKCDRLDDAIGACQAAICLNPQSAPAHALLGSLYEKKGDLASAVFEYEKSVALDPQSDTERKKLDELEAALHSSANRNKLDTLREAIRPYAPQLAAAFTLCIVILIGLFLILGGSKTSEKKSHANSQSLQETQPQVIPPVEAVNHRKQSTPVQLENQKQANRPDSQPAAGAQSLPTQAAKPTPMQPIPVTQTRETLPASKADETVDSPEVELSILPQSNGISQPQSAVIVPVYDENSSDKPSAELKVMTPSESAPQPNQAPPAITYVRSDTDPEGRAVTLQRRGKYLEAIDSYHRAIESFKQQQAAGRDSSEVERNIKACEAGIRINQEG